MIGSAIAKRGDEYMFEVKKHLIKVQGGRQYLPVAARLIWFRTEHPDWGIDTHAVAINVEKQYAVFEASVFNAEGKLMAKGTKMETIRGFGDWLEKAETGAIGRALAVCGFGTQFAPDLEESHNDSFNEYRQPNRYASNRNRMQRDSNRADNLSLVQHDDNRAETPHVGDNPTTSRLVGQVEICEFCSTVLKASQLALSLRKFGSALCPDCQRKRKSEQAA
jgi:hypothetical protein